jgi:hypothetical protein
LFGELREGCRDSVKVNGVFDKNKGDLLLLGPLYIRLLIGDVLSKTDVDVGGLPVYTCVP